MKIRNILVSQPQPSGEKSPYYDLETKYNVKFEFHQFIRVEEVTPKEFRAQHINILDYTAILFNSRLGVDHFFHLCEEMRVNIPESMHYYCLSKTIADYLQKYIQYRKRKVFYSENNNFVDLLPAMNRRPTEKYMMVLSDVHNDDVINMFASHKIHITPAVMYRTVTNDFAPEEKKDFDMYVLFTPAGVQAFKKNFPDFEQGEKAMGCLGANTAQALKAAGLRVDVMAPTQDCPSITTAIDRFLAQQNQE